MLYEVITSPEMAEAVKSLVQQPDVQKAGVFAMKGHENGVVFLGKSFSDLHNLINMF